MDPRNKPEKEEVYQLHCKGFITRKRDMPHFLCLTSKNLIVICIHVQCLKKTKGQDTLEHVNNNNNNNK